MSIKVETGQTLLEFNEKKNFVLIKKGNALWNWSEDFQARLVCREGEFLFRMPARFLTNSIAAEQDRESAVTTRLDQRGQNFFLFF